MKTIKNVSLKKAIKSVFPMAENIVEQSDYNMRSVWFVMDGKFWYLHTDGVGYVEPHRVYYREVFQNNYVDDINHWDFCERVEKLGLKLYVSPKKCDFNNN